jgi:hypothetical protein
MNSYSLFLSSIFTQKLYKYEHYSKEVIIYNSKSILCVKLRIYNKHFEFGSKSKDFVAYKS